MSAWPKIALVAGCGVALYAYGRKMTRTKANLIVIPEVSVASIGLTGLVLRANVKIKNPSDGGFTMKFPFVTLTYKGTLLGSSEVVNQDITIKGFGQANIKDIIIDIPLASVFSVVSGLINSIQKKEPVKIVIKVSSVVNLGWTRVNYDDAQEITLKN